MGWAICAGDNDAFRQAVRLSYTLWGGRFNPIVTVDRDRDARRLVDLFRLDLVLPVGDTEPAKEFGEGFRHLIKPFYGDVFLVEAGEKRHNQLLDIQNLLSHYGRTPEWEAIEDQGLRIYRWQPDDPLADMLMMQFGEYPADDTGVDYFQMLIEAGVTEHIIDKAMPIPAETLDHPTIAYLSRHHLQRHYTTPADRYRPGFFIGDVANVDDLVCYWNLRAADVPVYFVDPNHFQRYTEIIPAWKKTRDKALSLQHEAHHNINIPVWSCWRNNDDIQRICGELADMVKPDFIDIRNGLRLRPP